MKITKEVKAKALAELRSIYAEVKAAEVVDEEIDFEDSIPEELKLDAQAEEDLTLDNANPMIASDEDEIESLELEEECPECDKEACKASPDCEVEKEEIEETESDPVVNISEIIKGADDDGNIKLSSIKALVELPDDKKDDDIVSCKTASLEKPGIEDKIGDEAGGGDPSVSELKSIIGSLDEFAQDMESKGNKRLAYRIDRVTNQLDFELKNLNK